MAALQLCAPPSHMQLLGQVRILQWLSLFPYPVSAEVRSLSLHTMLPDAQRGAVAGFHNQTGVSAICFAAGMPRAHWNAHTQNKTWLPAYVQITTVMLLNMGRVLPRRRSSRAACAA